MSDDARVSLVGASVFGVFIVSVGVLLVYLLIKIWPATPHPARGGQAAQTGGAGDGYPIDLFWGRVEFNLLAETSLLALAAIMGALGATVFICVSFSDYVGNRRFARSWVWFYLVRLIVGPSLALIFYFALRGGFLATSSQSTDINPYGVAALAGLVGLFSKQAGDKLKQIFDALFQTPEGYGDSARADSVQNPQPTISGLEPPIQQGTTSLKFTVEGTGFIKSSAVSVTRVEGAAPSTLLTRKARFVNDGELEVTLDEADVTEPGNLYVAVTNPSPGGGVAGPFRVEVSEAVEDALAQGSGSGGVDDSATAPAAPPRVSTVEPDQLVVGTPDLTIAIVGENLSGGAITVASPAAPDAAAARPSEEVDDTKLSATLDPTDVAAAGTLTIRVAKGEDVSEPFPLEVVDG